MRRLAGGALLIALAGAAGAHPHHDTDQQVILSLGLARADIVLAVVPGTADGPAVVAHLDVDGDGTVSLAEADAYGAALLAGVTLLVDQSPVALTAAALDLPPLPALAAGEAGLRLKLSGDFALTPGMDHQVTLNVSQGLGEDWFIQPYYHADFAAGATGVQIDRPDPGNRLELRFQTKAEGS